MQNRVGFLVLGRDLRTVAFPHTRSLRKAVAGVAIFFTCLALMSQTLRVDKVVRAVTLSLRAAPGTTSSTSEWLEDIDTYRISQPECKNLRSKYAYMKEQDIMEMPRLPFMKEYKNPCWKEGQHLHCLPYMYLAGVAKCGTTDLFKRISLHPDFVSPLEKEPSWLSSRRFREKLDLKHYADEYFKPLARKLQSVHLGNKKQHLITGDGSINTLEGSHFWELYGPNVNKSEPVENNAEYIHHLYPETRILINVRNPIARLWSEYLAFSKDGNKSAERFHTIVKEEIDLYEHCIARRSLRSCLYDTTLARYASMDSTAREGFLSCQKKMPQKFTVMLRRGIYHVYIRDFLSVFPREQVLIQRLEDMATDIKTSLRDTFSFLKMRRIDNKRLDSIVNITVKNSRPEGDMQVGSMMPETKAMLWLFYKPHNLKLAILLNDFKFNYGPSGDTLNTN